MTAPADLTPLLARRHEFKSFLASRLGGNQADAEDLLQNSLSKALRTAAQVEHHEKLIPWFYQLLRNAVVDHVRSRHASREREHAWTHDVALLAPDETRHQICRCFEAVIPSLSPTHAELLRRVELEDQSVADAAAALSVTSNNASVILHRARTELRARLEVLCGPCAESACLDCDCGESQPA